MYNAPVSLCAVHSTKEWLRWGGVVGCALVMLPIRHGIGFGTEGKMRRGAVGALRWERQVRGKPLVLN
jgi:hypothetical protein